MVLEQIDELGNIVRVGDYVFEEGYLGQGSTAVVRLAHHLPKSSIKAQAGSSTSHQRPSLVNNIRPLESEITSNGDLNENSDSSSGGDPIENDADIGASENPAGCFGKVLNNGASNGANNDDDDLVAVKVFSKSFLKRIRTMERNASTRKIRIRTAYEKVEREVAILKLMDHPNIVDMIEVIDSTQSDTLYLVLEYLPKGEIMTFFPESIRFKRMPKKGEDCNDLPGVIQPGCYFEEMHASLYLVDILHGLAYLHQHHICHRDLKPENILLDANGVVKISDFGVSHVFEEESAFEDYQEPGSRRTLGKRAFLSKTESESALHLKTMSNSGLLMKTEGTWCFWSPEMCKMDGGSFSGYAADIWAVGVCLYVFVTGTLPFYSDDPSELFRIVSEDEIDYENITCAEGNKIPLSLKLVRLLKSILTKDPAERAGVGDCLSHDFLAFAQKHRVAMLGTELEKCKKLDVSIEDIRKAFSLTMFNEATSIAAQAVKLKSSLYNIRKKKTTSRKEPSIDLGGLAFGFESRRFSLIHEEENSSDVI